MDSKKQLLDNESQSKRGEAVRLSIVAALTQDHVIGNQGQLPWRLPNDLRRFRELTLGKPVLMGHTTYRSIGRPLPERTNLVLTRQSSLHIDGCLVVHSLEEALQKISGDEELMIVGGAHVYQSCLPLCHRMYLTIIEASIKGDCFFPPWIDAEWQEIERIPQPIDEKNPLPHTFVTYERVLK